MGGKGLEAERCQSARLQRCRRVMSLTPRLSETKVTPWSGKDQEPLLRASLSFQVQVLYFAKSAEITGVRSETLSVPEEIQAAQLWRELEARHPG